MPTPAANRDTAAADLALIESMMLRGRHAAADDGWHLVVWGGVSSVVLAVQYFAEVRDWAPSATLWWWQPAFLVACLASLGIGRRFAKGRLRESPITRTYRSAFGGAVMALGVYQLASTWVGRPDPLTSVVLLCGALGSAFFVTGIVTGMRWLAGVGGGWWLLLAWFAAKGQLVPTDFFVLAAATALLLGAPGARLAVQGRRATPRTAAPTA